jgi:hypothetical protein
MIITMVQAQDDAATIRELKFFGTPGPTTLDKGSLTLGRSLDVPRISRYDVDTETPRPEKLLLDFDTTVNESPIDISGQGNHGVLKSNCTYSAADKAFDFPGDGDRIQNMYFNGYSGAVIQSHSYWVKGVTVNVRSPVTVGRAIGGTSGEYLSLLVDTGGWQINADGWSHDYDETIDTTRWYHVVVTYDGGNSSSSYKLYIDGKYKTPTGSNGTFGSLSLEANTDIRIGRDSGVGWFTGMISNIKIYSVALEASEAKKLYNLGRTGRSMVISDTAVGIGKVPEAQLDVRGNIKCDVIMPNVIAFSAFRESPLAGGDLSTTASFQANATYYNYGNAYNTSNGEFKAPINGVYHIHWNAYTNQTATTTSRIFLLKNGSIYTQVGNSIERMGNSISVTLHLAAGDYVSINGAGSYPLYYHGSKSHHHYSGYLVYAT